MELLDPLRKVRVLRIASQHGRLIQMLSTILDAMDFDTNLNPSLLEV